MSASAYTYFQSLRGIVATQTTTNKPVSQNFHLIAKHVCQRERESSIYLITSSLRAYWPLSSAPKAKPFCCENECCVMLSPKRTNWSIVESKKGRKVSLTAGN
jgi:hypothetical protein